MAWTNCEYCFLKDFTVHQVPGIATTGEGEEMHATTSGWQIDIVITCDLLDSNRNSLDDFHTASDMITLSGTWREGIYTQSEIFAMYDAITTTVSGHMSWAKEYYAGYIMI
jgi:hypothetical protein